MPSPLTGKQTQNVSKTGLQLAEIAAKLRLRHICCVVGARRALNIEMVSCLDCKPHCFHAFALGPIVCASQPHSVNDVASRIVQLSDQLQSVSMCLG